MADSQNRDRSESQLSNSDRDMGSTTHPSDQRSGQHVSAGSSGAAGGQREDAREGREDSGIRRESEGGGASEEMAKNDSQDAAVELSDRGGIRPERDDASEYTDRSRDRA
jgi:hypothetical protein